MSSLNELKVDSKRGRPSKPLALTLEEGGDVDVLVALSESVGRPVSVLVDPRECLKADKAAARECLKAEKAASKAAARECLKASKAAARLALKAEKSAALEAARGLAKKEKADAREALKAEKAAARLALKAEKSAALEAARALAKKEKADAREVLKAEKAAAKAEKAAAKALEKAEKGKAKKPAAQLVAALARADEPVPELQVEGYEEEEEVCVRVFEWKDKRWLRDDAGAIYDPESHDEVGRWDEESQSVVAMKMPTEPRMTCDNA